MINITGSNHENGKYVVFKNSRVEILGDIPENWSAIRLKYIAKINADTIPETMDSNFQFKYVDIGSVSFDKGIEYTEAYKFKDAPSRARRIARAGDTIISTVRTYLKAIDYVSGGKEGYIFSTGFAVLHPMKNLYDEFLFHYVRSNAFTEQVMINSLGMSYPAINSTKLGRLSCAIPTAEEQHSIVRYIRAESTKIDKAIAQKNRITELLKERKQLIVQNALTKGLDPNVKMKNSGIEGLGMIPAHWLVKRLKYLLKERNERSNTGDEPLFMVSQIHGLVVRSKFHAKAEIAESSVGNKLVYTNDLVFNKLKAHLGVFFKSCNDFKGLVSPDYAVYCSNGIISDLKILELLFRHPAYISQFITRATGIVEGLIRLYTDDLFAIHVPVPSSDEQIEILNFISVHSAKYDKVIAAQQKQTEKLKEFKATLIDSAVTGKIKVY